ncbi:MAG: DUF1289 domain-containing protein [Variovorax sp.]|nr:MAG: DUF1289 domain-containing protein [Variovorax sp.]
MPPAVEALARQARRVRLSGEAGGGNEALPVPSPCISVCRMDAARVLCEGCFRTIPEIAGWSRMTDDGKRAVWACIAQRLPEPAP